MSELPRGWELVSFGDLLLDAQNGCGSRSGTGTPTVVLRLADVNTAGIVASDGLREIGLSEAERQKYALRTGDLLAFRVNGSREITGRIIRYVGPEGHAYCDHFIRFRTDPARVDSSFAARAFNVSSIRQQVEVAMVSSAGQNTVSQGSLREVKLPLPPIDEQRRIVAKLETLQASSRRARAALDAVPPLLEKLRQSILAAAFRGDLTKDWRAKNKNVEPASELLKRIRIERRKKWEETELAKLKAKGKAPTDDRWKAKYKEPEPVDTEGLPELPEGWAWASVEELSTKAVDGVHAKPHYVPSGIPFLTVKNLTAGPGISFADVNYITAEDHAELIKRTDPEPGDILISKDGTLGVTRMVRTDATFSIFVSLALVKPVVRSMGEYLEAAFWSPYFQERFKATGSGLLHIHLGDLRASALPICPEAEQPAVLDRVREQLARLESAERYLVQLTDTVSVLNRALLAHAFRGQLLAAGSVERERKHDGGRAAPKLR